MSNNTNLPDTESPYSILKPGDQIDLELMIQQINYEKNNQTDAEK